MCALIMYIYKIDALACYLTACIEHQPAKSIAYFHLTNRTLLVEVGGHEYG